jgi:hypothetical protein
VVVDDAQLLLVGTNALRNGHVDARPKCQLRATLTGAHHLRSEAFMPVGRLALQDRHLQPAGLMRILPRYTTASAFSLCINRTVPALSWER